MMMMVMMMVMMMIIIIIGVTKIVVKWLTLLLRTGEVPGSNLGQETGYPEGSRGFPQSLLGEYLKLGHDILFLHPFHSSFISHHFIRRHIADLQTGSR
jgi:hypothetical protein